MAWAYYNEIDQYAAVWLRQSLLGVGYEINL